MIPGKPIPPLEDLLGIAVVGGVAGLLVFLRGLMTPTAIKKTGIVYVFSYKLRIWRTILRIVVTIGGSFGAGFTAGLLAYGAGYSHYWAWAAAIFGGVMGWDFFNLIKGILKSRTEGSKGVD